jgi:hypothetical protein
MYVITLGRTCMPQGMPLGQERGPQRVEHLLPILVNFFSFFVCFPPEPFSYDTKSNQTDRKILHKVILKMTYNQTSVKTILTLESTA